MRQFQKRRGRTAPSGFSVDLNMAYRMDIKTVFDREGVADMGQPLILFVLEISATTEP